MEILDRIALYSRLHLYRLLYIYTWTHFLIIAFVRRNPGPDRMRTAPVRFIQTENNFTIYSKGSRTSYLADELAVDDDRKSCIFFSSYFVFFFFTLGPSKTIFPRFTRASRVMFSRGISLRSCTPNRFRAPAFRIQPFLFVRPYASFSIFFLFFFLSKTVRS